jgi:hypothetical protein
MKTRSLCAGAVRAFLVLAAAAILAACAPPLDSRGEGNLRIVLAGRASPGARAAIDPPEDVSYYRLDFSGPGGETLSETLQSGTELTVTLNLGQWTIRVEAFTAEEVLLGSGATSAPVTVEAGRTTEAAIAIRLALAEITAFNFDSLEAEVSVDSAAKTVTVSVPYGTDVTNLVPAITVSPGATIDPASGEAQNFTNPVLYTVTAANGSTQVYEVTVNVQEQNSILLAGTVTVVKPDSLVLTGITVTAYKEAGRTTVIGTAALSPPSEAWDMEFPVSSLAESGTAWFRVSATGGTNSYTVDAGDSGVIPESGITDLDLALRIYGITIDPAIAGGSVIADKSYETAGNTIGLTVEPDDGYILKSGTLQYSDGTDNYPIPESGPEYSFEMPAADVTISAFFNKGLGFTVEGPSERAVGVTAEHSAGAEPATEISWSGDEFITFTLESSDYTVEGGNLKWIVNGIEISAANGNSLVIRARDYVQRSYTVTVMIAEDGQWYSTEIPFEVTE